MNNVLTIAKRELNAYFTSPIGYIVMIVFVAVTVVLYMLTFFSFPVADMRPYFASIPMMLSILIAAITMRIWAQERSENTWEMLLTFPMKAWELVIGKFVASLVFFLLTLSATATIPIMLAQLGDPDGGVIFSSYLGTLLLGAYFLSIGIFFSGFFKDQILSFIVTLLTCFAIFMLGNTLVAAYLDNAIPGLGLGTLLNEVVGLSGHYTAFVRGVIEVADIVYFLVWTAIFLFLNILYIDGRSRAGAKVIFSTAVTIALAIGLMGNWLVSDTSLGRFDMTEDKIFTVSQASKNILSAIDTPVQVKVYISPKKDMPTGMTSLQQDITDKLEEFSVASKGKIEYTVINLEASQAITTEIDDGLETGEEEDETEEEVIEKRLLEKGVQPFTVQAMSDDQIMNKLIYSSIGIAYKDKKEEILPPILPQGLQDLEYQLVSTIYKLTREKKPIVALVAPKEAINIPPDLRRMYEQMGQPVPESDDPYEILEQILDFEKYEVIRVDLTPESSLPDEYDTLVVINPREFNERQRWEINRALLSGKSVVMAVQTYEWNYSASARGTQINSREENPNMNPLLEAYGLGVSEELLMDVNHVALTIQAANNPLAGALGMGQQVTLETHMLINNEMMDEETSITSRLNAIFYLWGTALEIDEEKLGKLDLEAKVLITTSKRSWTTPNDPKLSASVFDEPAETQGRYPLMALVEGQFPDAFADQERPAWPMPEAQLGMPPATPIVETDEVAEITPAPGKLILLGCSEMFRKQFLQFGNLDLFLNSVDAVTLGDDVVNVRGQKLVDRLIEMPNADTRRMWKFINYGLPSTAIALVGIVSAFLRRRSRNAYTLSQMNENQD
ncbi:MAG: Gldg family protein [Candidatus Hydrogenedentota bacterium]